MLTTHANTNIDVLVAVLSANSACFTGLDINLSTYS